MNSNSRSLRFSGDIDNSQKLLILTILSLILHLFFLSIAFFFFKQDNSYIQPSSYVVNLVSSESASTSPGTGSESKQPSDIKKEALSKDNTKGRESKSIMMGEKATKTNSKKDEELISERIEAIKAKKRVEQIAGLRNIISLQAGGGGKKGVAKGVGGKGGSSLTDDYYSRITSEIWQHWIYPDMGSKDIEAIIVIKILKDGSVQIKGVERSSGNSLFDRSAIRAITKASPLTPPPYEMEIGVRFYP
ncbi:MAG: energy transducer TonB [Thermodesulfovibrionales bacterium]